MDRPVIRSLQSRHPSGTGRCRDRRFAINHRNPCGDANPKPNPNSNGIAIGLTNRQPVAGGDANTVPFAELTREQEAGR